MVNVSSKRFQYSWVITLFVFVLGSCATTKSNYQREYTRVWKEIIKSEAWKNSLLPEQEAIGDRAMEFYASNDVALVEDRFTTKLDMEALFDKRFNTLVSRAYVKIISEAENADDRLKAEYGRWSAMQKNPDFKKDKDFRKKYEVVTKKYHAHRQMLEGLKSWNIFSEFGTNDLDFFKVENRGKIWEMYQNGSTEDKMINYLVYKLADLYHYGE